MAELTFFALPTISARSNRIWSDYPEMWFLSDYLAVLYSLNKTAEKLKKWLQACKLERGTAGKIFSCLNHNVAQLADNYCTRTLRCLSFSSSVCHYVLIIDCLKYYLLRLYWRLCRWHIYKLLCSRLSEEKKTVFDKLRISILLNSSGFLESMFTSFSSNQFFRCLYCFLKYSYSFSILITTNLSP